MELVIEDNEILSRRLDGLFEENHKKVKFADEDNWNSIHEIMDEVSVSKAKIEDLSEKLEQREN